MIRIYGASDDLIEIESTTSLFSSDEFPASPDDDATFIGASDGTLIEFTFNRRGIWRADIIRKGTAFLKHHVSEDKNDIVVLDDIVWVMIGKHYAL